MAAESSPLLRSRWSRLQESLKTMMSEAGRDVLDLGTNSPDSVDYPDFANVLTSAIGDGSAEGAC